jgi:peptidoglycan/xylan/chitin deacetylase (PgdA/CDA1 family)
MNIPILMYHQVDTPEPKGTKLRGLTVSPASFASQMALLKLYGYSGLSMCELEPYLSGQKTGKVVGITFDDGYQNNLVNALPVLQKNGFSATCYGVSTQINGTNAWDKGIGIRQKPLMSKEDWYEWRRGGMEIASHGRTHGDLNAISQSQAIEEIALSKMELEQEFQCPVRHFCYPYGRYSDVHLSMVKEAGYVTATTTNRGRVHGGHNPFELNRIMVARACNWIQFSMKILTSYEDKRS